MIRTRATIGCISFAGIVSLFIVNDVLARSLDDVVAGIRKKVVVERTYTFGVAEKFTLKDEQAVLLKCSKNPDRITEVLICLTSDFFRSKCLYIWCLREEGIKGGGSPVKYLNNRRQSSCPASSRWQRAADHQPQSSYI